MGKHWVRQQIKRNEVQEAVGRALAWTAGNRRTAGIAAGVSAGVILCAGLFLYSYRARQNAAWDQLSLAYGYASGGKADAAVKKVDELNAEYPASAASGYGLLFAGDLLFHRERSAESVKYYQQLLGRGRPQVLLPLAWGGLAAAQEAAGKCSEAVETGERFLGAYPDHFLAPQVHMSLARCQASLGRADAARAAWQKIALQYPDTSWAQAAQERLKALGGGA